MGHLLLIATGNDFTLKTKSFKKQFEYLKYPESFRASLVQLTNIGWDAFNEAHINMDSMKLHMTNIDSHLKLLVNVMTEGTNDEVQYFSTKTLKKIELIADECLKLSLDVEARFLLFMNVTTELLEASTVAKGSYEEKAKDTKMAIRAAKEEVNKSKEEKEILAKDLRKSRRRLKLKKDSEHTDAHHQGIKIIKNALEYSDKLIELDKELMRDDDEVKQVVINIEDVHLDVKQFLADAKEHMYKTRAGWKQTILSSDTLVQYELTRSSIKVESSRDALKDSRRSKEETFQNILKTNKRITDTLKELESFKIEEVNFDDIRKILAKGLNSISSSV
ncbi:unnamed protein product [Mytilus edulis]|uniref:Uncharacterized protein n=1 Tax=Mytilus edulis TaxID=6550 RepID=A0A8S3SD15_MYTED|nr:unnamed protein product [Mytilus edulis]